MDPTATTLKQFGDLGNPLYIFKVKIYIDIFKAWWLSLKVLQISASLFF